jgi:hypothetical protein
MRVMELNHFGSVFQRFCFGLERFVSLFSIFTPPRIPYITQFIKTHALDGLPSIMCFVLQILRIIDHP